MNNESYDQFNPKDLCQVPPNLVFQPTHGDYRTFNERSRSQVDQANAALVGAGLLSDLQIDSETSSTSIHYLKGHVSNVPEISQGIQNIDDAKILGSGVVAGLQSFAEQSLSYLATPYAVHDTILQIGPILDTAVDYYANTPANQVVNDARSIVGSIGDGISQALSYPLKLEQRGAIAGVLMPMFAADAIKVPSSQKLESLSSDELAESQLSDVRKLMRGAGKGGDWPVLNERFSTDCVLQFRPTACVAAIGEMLSEGRLNQVSLFEKVGTVPELLPQELGPEWICKFVEDREDAFAKLIHRGKSWGAELKDEFRNRVGMGHMVVVDGLDEAGNVMIRDPQDATRYEMKVADFIKHWTARAVYR